jgi:hypothetical protein
MIRSPVLLRYVLPRMYSAHETGPSTSSCCTGLVARSMRNAINHRPHPRSGHSNANSDAIACSNAGTRSTTNRCIGGTANGGG